MTWRAIWRSRSLVVVAVPGLLAGIALGGCGSDREGDAGQWDRHERVISEAIGDDLTRRELVPVDSVQGSGRALRGTGVPRLGRDDEWMKRPATGWQLARLEMERDEAAFAWLPDGQPLLSEPPTFEWDQITVDSEGRRFDHLVLMPQGAQRPQGYVMRMSDIPQQEQRARAIVQDVTGRELSDVQAEALLKIVRELHDVEDERVLDWLERLSRGEVNLATLDRRDAGVEDGQLFGRRQIKLHRSHLSQRSPRWHALRDEAAVALLPASNYQRTQPLRELLADPQMGHHALRAVRQHHPLPRPMAETLVELVTQWIDEASGEHDDTLRVQVTVVLDAIGGHDWELMTDQHREAAEQRERLRGGDRLHLDLAVDFAIAVMHHPNFDVQQTALRMIQRWTEWGWEIPHRQRLEAAANDLTSEQVREQLLELLRTAD